MKRILFLLLIFAAALCAGCSNWNRSFGRKDDGKIVLVKIEGSIPKTKLGHNCIYTHAQGEKRVYSYAYGSGSIQCHSLPGGEAIFDIRRVGGKGGYHLGSNFSLIGDINEDGFGEIAAPESWANKELLIFSGKDGTQLKRVRLSEVPFWHDGIKILSTYDHDGDGIDDFFVNYKTLVLLSSRDITVIGTFALPESTHMVHIMEAPDLDGDGKDDVLAFGRKKDRSSEPLILIYLSSKDGKILKSQSLKLKNGRFLKAGSFLYGSDIPLLLSDMDGDNFPEPVSVVDEEYSFEGTTYTGNVLVCFSSASENELWRVKGWTLTRKENLQFSFGSKIVYPDINEDGVEEIIVAYMGQYIKKDDLAVYLLIFSGKDGKLLKKKRIAGIKGTLPTIYEIIPDMDGDMMGEILMGSTGYDAGEAENAGGIFIVSSRLLTS